MQELLPQIPSDFIVPLNMNGLRGRMLRLPAKRSKKREILLVYGRHSSIERVYGLAQALNNYGAVTVPDLPGFGGMDSFYKINEKPDIDTMADYLASVIKLRYARRRVTLAGVSYGFAVITRMLQRYPDIAKKSDMLVGWAGFAHHEDFRFSKRRMLLYRLWTRIFSMWLPATLYKNVMLHPSLIRRFYAWQLSSKNNSLSDKAKVVVESEVRLWRTNDLRTHMATTLSCLKLDNCSTRVNLPVWHVGLKSDNYLDNDLAEQHLRVVFESFTQLKAASGISMPGVVADKKDYLKIIPAQLRRELNKKD